LPPKLKDTKEDERKVFMNLCDFVPLRQIKFLKSSFIYFFLFAVVVSSCKKEKSSVLFSAISSGTEDHLYSVRKLKGDTLMACGGNNDKGILLLSPDKGNSWSILNNSFDQPIYDFYFINGQLGFAGGEKAEVFKTTDGGKTCEKIPLPFPLTGFPLNYRLPLRRIFFVNDSLGFMCGGGKFEAGIIFKTIDQGQNWTLTTLSYELRGLLFTDEHTGYACGFGVILKTTDSGNNWNAIESPNEFYTSLVQYSGELWTSGYNGGIYKSEELNTDWQPVNKSNDAVSSRSHFNCLGISPGGTIAALGTDGIISISYDHGNTWEEGESFNRSTIKSFLLIDDHSGIAVGDNGKIFKFSF